MLTYMYTIISSNPSTKMMEVEYTTAGQPSVTVGMPLPSVGMPVTDVVKAYAPIRHWLDTDRPVDDVMVGTNGMLTHDTAGSYTTPTTVVETVTGDAAVDPAPPLLADSAASDTPIQPANAIEQEVTRVLVKLGLIAADPVIVLPTPVDLPAATI